MDVATLLAKRLPIRHANSSAAEAVKPQSRLHRLLGGIEWAVVAIVALAALAMHLRLFRYVGALWRDEVNSVNVANLPTLADTCRFLDYDSFPVLFFTVLRGWTAIFGLGNDTAYRAYGLLVGCGVLAVLWLNARSLGSRLPLMSLALVGLNPMIIRYGDSVRAYGLGILLILLTFGAYWRLVQAPRSALVRRSIIAAVLALLSVQCLYYNSVLLLAISAGAMAVALRHRAWGKLALVLGIGLIAASSLLPYVPMVLRMREWTFLVWYPADLQWLWQRGCEVLGGPQGKLRWVWSGLFAGALLLTFGQALRSWRRLPDGVLFSAVALLVGVVGYVGFLNALNYYTQPWYYITLVAFAACALDCVFGSWPTPSDSPMRFGLRAMRPGFALCLLAVSATKVWDDVAVRHTNVDLVTSRLGKIAKPEDVIVLARWETAVSFMRYYHGAAQVLTLPPIPDHRFHRYDLVLEMMKTEHPHVPVLERIENVLRSGNRVYFWGSIETPEPGESLPVLRPFYRDENGMPHGTGYHAAWRMWAGTLLQQRAGRLHRMPLRVAGYEKVRDFEDFEVIGAEGWR